MKRFYSLLLAIVLGSTLNGAFAAIDIFMRIKDANGTVILGESQNQNYPSWTELSSYGSGISSPVTIGGSNSGATIGKSSFDTLQFQVALSSISLPLSKLLTGGTRLSEVDIWFTKPNGTNSCTCAFYKIHMEDVFITNIKEAAGDENITQEISVKPVKIAWAYYKQKADGTYLSSPTNQHSWDYSINRTFSYNF